MNVGIEKLVVNPCSMFVSMEELVRARGGDVDEVCGAMMITERSVNPPWEDPVTMAVNACNELLTDEDRSSVKLLLVGSESGPDQEKSLSTWIQRYARLGDDCRNLEIKHACYAGTGALGLAATWLLAQPAGTKALVVTTDQSRQHFGQPYEFVMGAGAVAMLVSRTPSFLRLELGNTGFFTHEVSDLTRPTSRIEAGHSETSLLSYLDAVDLTFERYCKTLEAPITTADQLRSWLPYQIYHAPFGGITMRAHRALWRTLDDFNAAACREDFETRVEPSLVFNRRMGGTYASSVFISLLGSAASFGDLANGRRVGVYSYGSGSSAEYFSGVFGHDAWAVTKDGGLAEKLDARHNAGVRGYEDAERERTAFIDCGDFTTSKDGHDGLFERRYAGHETLIFEGMKDFERQYRWANA